MVLQLAALIFVAGLLPAALWAKPVIEQLEVSQPRAYGYHIGDRAERKVKLSLSKPYTLDLNRLPAAGRISDWLTLARPTISQTSTAQSTHYVLGFDYQIVNIDRTESSIAIPFHYLYYGDGSDDNDEQKAHISASRIRVSSLREENDTRLQANQAPRLIEVSNRDAVIYAAIFMLAMLGASYLLWGSPFRSSLQPFAEAYRKLSRQSKAAWDDHGLESALRIIHGAFNETAGKTVFAETVGEFIEHHQAYARLETSIREFFRYSSDFFFNPQAAADNPAMSPGALQELIKACRDAERGLL